MGMALWCDYMVRLVDEGLDISLQAPGFLPYPWYVSRYLWSMVQMPLTLVALYELNDVHYHYPTLMVAAEDDQLVHSKVHYEPFLSLGCFFVLLFTFFLYLETVAHVTGTSLMLNYGLYMGALMVALLFSIKGTGLPQIWPFKSFLSVLLTLCIGLVLWMGKGVVMGSSLLLAFVSVGLFLCYAYCFELLVWIQRQKMSSQTLRNGVMVMAFDHLARLVFYACSANWAYMLDVFKGKKVLITMVCLLLF